MAKENIQVHSDRVEIDEGIVTVYLVDLDELMGQFSSDELLKSIESNFDLGTIVDFVTQRTNDNKEG